jgi:hypothetical protein
MVIILFTLFCVSFGQVAPYDFSSSKTHSDNKFIVSDSMIDQRLDISLNDYSNEVIIDSKRYIEFPITLENLRTIKIQLNHSDVPSGTKFFLIDLDDNDFIGPFYALNNYIKLGAINASNFIIQCIIPNTNAMQNFNLRLERIYDLSNLAIKKNEEYFSAPTNDRENPIIVVTGFWPPTNEMIRHFSQDINLNPSGWQGEDWQGSGYDVIAFFPEFEDPDCSSCGTGYGDFEVDYQDTSGDFWSIIDQIDPISIITFSRGYTDESWELEFNYYNRTNWSGDYVNPFLPTPNPPDSDVPAGFLRNSNLPMQEIMDDINSSGLGLNSYIDIDGHPGAFVSEFMGLHGVWYRDLYQFDDNPCYLAGHVHVGGLIDWDTATEAAEITISTVIESLNEYTYIPGDANNDENIDILDIITAISHILGNQILEGPSFYAADMNSNGIINIQDIILIINLIL